MMMKVEAIIRPERLEEVKSALDEIGIVGITVIEVRGHGKQRGYTQRYRGAEYAVTLLPKVKIETVVDESRVDDVVNVIVSSARTGEVGDGKVFVLPVSNAIRVRTGEQGDAAVF
jgi:nitrogen regulatory protein P-II 1